MRGVTIMATVTAVYLFIVGCLLAWWSNVTASAYSASTASAAVNGVSQWFTSAGNWLIQTLW